MVSISTDMDLSLDDIIKKEIGNRPNKRRRPNKKKNNQSATPINNPPIVVMATEEEKRQKKAAKRLRYKQNKQLNKKQTPTPQGLIQQVAAQGLIQHIAAQGLVQQVAPQVKQPLVPQGLTQASQALATQGASNKLDISNLHHNVTESDIRELFSDFGKIKSCAIHYNKNGASLGTAHVHFSSAAAATAAYMQYNGVHLDGQVMRISFKSALPQIPNQIPMAGFSGVSIQQRLSQLPMQMNLAQVQNNQPKSKNKKRKKKGQGARVSIQKNLPKLTAEQLDEQLQEYISAAQK